MLKLNNITKTDFDNFINASNLPSHFMQTSAWGEFDKVTNNTTPHYIGLLDEEKNVVAATLLIEEHLAMNCSLLYAPRGLIIDYKDRQLLRTFIYKLKDFAKQKKAIALKINPELNYKIKVDENKKINKNTAEIVAHLREMGFRRKATERLLNYNYCIDLKQSSKDLEVSFSENIKKSLKDSEIFDLELTQGTAKDLKELFTLNNNQNNEYYETLYDIFSTNQFAKVKLFLGKLHITKTLKNLERDLKKVNNQISIIPIDHLDSSSKEKLTNLKEQKNNILLNLEKFKDYKLKYGNYLTISAALEMEHNSTVWTLYETKAPLLDELNLKYAITNQLIKYYKDNNFNYFNELSIFSKESSEDDKIGTYTEYIGEFDLITNHFMYFMHKRILPLFNKKK